MALFGVLFGHKPIARSHETDIIYTTFRKIVRKLYKSQDRYNTVLNISR